MPKIRVNQCNLWIENLYTAGLLIVFLIYPLTASAQGLQVTPSIGLRQEYNDNVLISEVNEFDDYITRISPGLKIENHTERINAILDAIVTPIYYKDHDDLNGTNQYYKGSLYYRPDDRSRFGGSASYRVDTQRDSDLQDTGFILSAGERRRSNLSASGERAFTELTSLSLSAALDRDDYENPINFDNDSYNVNLMLTHHLGYYIDNTVARFRMGHASYAFDRVTTSSISNGFQTVDSTINEDNTSNNTYMTAGISNQITERLSIIADLGVRHTRNKNETRLDQRITDIFGNETIVPTAVNSWSDDTWGFTGYLSGGWQMETWSADLSFSHEMRPSSGNSGTVENTSFTFAIAKRFSEEFRLSLQTGYRFNKTDRTQPTLHDIDEETGWVTPVARYAFTKAFNMDVGYQHTLVNDRERDSERHRNLVYVSFNFNYPLLDR